MTDDRETTTELQAESQGPSPEEKTIRASNVMSVLFAVPVFGVIIGAGLLNILAAEGLWNPFHWDGRLWTGILMIAAPGALALMGALPDKIRAKTPDALLEVTVLLVWVAFFWAACGGH